MAASDPTNYLFVNTNGDIWVVPGEPGGVVEKSVQRFEGVPAELVERLRDQGWDLDDEIRAELRKLPSIEF